MPTEQTNSPLTRRNFLQQSSATLAGLGLGVTGGLKAAPTSGKQSQTATSLNETQPHYFKPEWIVPTDRNLKVDLCIYGGTAAGVIAAKTATDLGHSVAILNPGIVLGGMTTGGLGWTDFGQKGVIGGRSEQFYRDVGKVYGQDKPEWHFIPSVAQTVIDAYAKDCGPHVEQCQFLHKVEMDGQRIVAVRMLGGLRVEAAMFIDATYEGDLMAHAGVRYTVGREANSVYGETINGVQIGKKHQFTAPIDPYVKKGDPTSGLLPWINEREAAPTGSGDHRIQAYNFRMCMTNDPALKIDWEKPEGYDDVEYELARRWFAAEDKGWNKGWNDKVPNYAGRPESLLKKFDVLRRLEDSPFYKTDTNNHGPFSTDFIGANYAWPDGSYAERERSFQHHVRWTKGFFWMMANDDRIPGRYRSVYAEFGLPKDEFTQSGHWPHQLYVREARRMIGDYVLTEQDTDHKRSPEDPVAMGSYTLDSHNCQRFVRDGHVLNEGDVQRPPVAPYGISYRSIVPARGQCTNLFSPVCVSASHIAHGSVRMEPVFIALAESAAIAASMAIKNDQTVQDVPYKKLAAALENAGQVLRYKG